MGTVQGVCVCVCVCVCVHAQGRARVLGNDGFTQLLSSVVVCLQTVVEWGGGGSTDTTHAHAKHSQTKPQAKITGHTVHH